MSKIADALRKSQATRLVTHDRAKNSTEWHDDAEPRPSSFTPSDEVLELEPGRDLILTDEPLQHSEDELGSKRIIYPGMKDKTTENAFRDLRTLITQKTGGGNSIILVTSVRRGGGASFVSFNLGVAFAMDWARTSVVVDCNFRRPAYYNSLLENEANGISDFLADPKVRIDDIVQTCGIPRVRIICAGQRRHDVADLVNSKRADRLVKELKRRYRERTVFMDTAPITQSADAQVLMEYCDYVLLVVPYGKSDEQEIAAAAELIPKKKFIGVVFNNEPRIGRPS